MRAILATALCLTLYSFGTYAFAQVEPIQPGDTLQISVWQDPKLDRQVVVGPDGMIAFPLAGHIRAGGITAQALEGILVQRLRKNYNGQLDVTVSLAAVNQTEELETKPRIYISGEVLKPGPYVLKPSIDIAQAIALAGGLSPFAASTRIQIHRKVRGGDSIFVFDYKAFQAGSMPSGGDINLRPGDVIIVPERGLLE